MGGIYPAPTNPFCIRRGGVYPLPDYTAFMASPDTAPDPNSLVSLGRLVRRRWRRFRRRWSAPQVKFVYHDIYATSLEGSPVDPARGQKILGFLMDEGLLEEDEISIPRRPAVRTLLRVHDHYYIDAVGRDQTALRGLAGLRFE